MDISNYGSASSVTFDTINRTLYSGLSAQETKLQDNLAKISADADGNISQTELLTMQQLLSQWTLTTDIMSTMIKAAGDALKGIVQKAS